MTGRYESVADFWKEVVPLFTYLISGGSDGAFY